MLSRSLMLILAMGGCAMLQAQDNPDSEPPATEVVPKDAGAKSADPTAKQLKKSAEKLTTQTEGELEKIAKTVDLDPRAKTAAAGILQPIYTVAESLSFPAFHWLAFALMTAGVVSYALQLGLGKLVVLMRLGFSLKEIISDAVGLAISVTGLVLTTQAAAENSTFTQSPAAVISATAVGGLVGIILYVWGQSQEIQAAAGRSKVASPKKT